MTIAVLDLIPVTLTDFNGTFTDSIGFVVFGATANSVFSPGSITFSPVGSANGQNLNILTTSYTGAKYYNSRLQVGFDTAFLSGATVSAARLKIRNSGASGVLIGNNNNVDVQLFKGTRADSNNLVPADYAAFTGSSLGSVTFSSLGIPSPSDLGTPAPISTKTIDFSPSHLNTTGISKFVLRTSQDAGSLSPNGVNGILFSLIQLEIEYTGGVSQTPGAPTSLLSTGGVQQVSLSWAPPADIGGGPITGYSIYYQPSGTTTEVGAATNSYIVTGLTNGTQYTFFVKAKNSYGYGPSANTTATPAGSVSLPAAPTDLIGTAGSEQVSLQWTASTGQNITNYVVKVKKASDDSLVLNPTTPTNGTTYTVSGLTNGTSYKFSVAARNSAGIGSYTADITLTPEAVDSVPSSPQGVTVSTGNSQVYISWAAPASDGGSPILSYNVYLYKVGVETPTINSFSASTFNQHILGLINGQLYYCGVSAVNAIGEGPLQLSPQFSPSVTGGTVGTQNTIVVTKNYSDDFFFAAPVDLNPESVSYLDYIYPETVQKYNKSYVLGAEAIFPIYFSNEDRKVIAFNVDGNKTIGYYYEINLNKETTYEIEDVYTLINNKIEKVDDTGVTGIKKVECLIINGQLYLERTEAGAGKSVTLTETYGTGYPIGEVDNEIAFGNYTQVDSYAETVVINHVPTLQYDALNARCLVEAEPLTSITNKDMTGSIINSNTIGYTIQLPVNNIRPKTVRISWLNPSGTKTTLVDYFGDGYLYTRTKVINSDGSISYEYTPEPDSTIFAYGVIDYLSGKIYRISFPEYKSPLIVGLTARFPVTVVTPKKLGLVVNGVNEEITIPTGTYTVQSIVNYLNGLTAFKDLGLFAGATNGQLYIENGNYTFAGETKTANPAPDKTLTLTTAITGESANFILFGAAPRIINGPKIYVSYSYGISGKTKFNYIWYQTPHFILKVKETNYQYVTKSHLDYILNKIKEIKPATTVLDAIKINPTYEELVSIYDLFNIEEVDGTSLTPPYIIVNGIPAWEGQAKVTIIEVENPDEQSDTTDLFQYN